MKHFEPFRTYLSPLRTAVVRMPDTSEPASGSVRQNDASFGASVSIPRYFCLISSEPPSTIGAVARPLHIRVVPMPEQPQPISSSIRQPVKKSSPGPPYSSGMWVFIRPTSQAFWMMSPGQSPSLSNSQATGRISFSAKLCASSRMSFCSSVSVKSTTGAPCSQRRRATASPEVRRLIDSSVNAAVRVPFIGAEITDSAPGAGLRARCSPVSAAEEDPDDDVDPRGDGQYREQDQAYLLGVHGGSAR